MFRGYCQNTHESLSQVTHSHLENGLFHSTKTFQNTNNHFYHFLLCQGQFSTGKVFKIEIYGLWVYRFVKISGIIVNITIKGVCQGISSHLQNYPFYQQKPPNLPTNIVPTVEPHRAVQSNRDPHSYTQRHKEPQRVTKSHKEPHRSTHSHT